MITLSRLLTLQWIYIILGVGYNIISYVVVLNGGQQLSTTPPLRGAPSMMMYGVFMLAAYFGYFKIYRFFMFCSIFIYGLGGIAIHLINYSNDPSMYASFIAWFLAIGINIFGLGLSLIALFNKFENDRLQTD